ncbi:winged helix-turn-helix domain-containing protein [Haladaptatus sp. CMSO5]|uniref:winged helix-turn-helix domain-containing protein n=1 Tax=Haladaptatus sp. CMSO5 TaxID=3120514 RepID=UPI002FCE3D8F
MLESVEASIEALRAENLFDDSTLVSNAGGHGAARAIVLSLLETTRQELGNGVERVEFQDGAVAVYDGIEGKLYIRRPPDLSVAAAVVGLDGTPVLRIWEGRLGCPPDQELEYQRVLCDECRTRYLKDVLGYRIYQTSPHIKPYSSGVNIHQEKDLALIEAVYRQTGTKPAVISTKIALATLENQWSFVQDSGHYGAIKGTNRFGGEDLNVGIVLGSQHPGDHEVKRLAALNGDCIEIPKTRLDRGKNLPYGIKPRPEESENPYLSHFREHQVVQAILRFGRSTGATVYVHTGAVPDWILTDGSIDSEKEVFRRVRSEGEREVLKVLEESSMTVVDLTEHVAVSQRTVYDRLADLEADGIVEQIGDKQPYRWRVVNPESIVERGHLINDRWYIDLPGPD